MDVTWWEAAGSCDSLCYGVSGADASLLYGGGGCCGDCGLNGARSHNVPLDTAAQLLDKEKEVKKISEERDLFYFHLFPFRHLLHCLFPLPTFSFLIPHKTLAFEENP